MIRITISIDGTEVSSSTVQPGNHAYLPAPERLAQVTGVAPIDAGSAPSAVPTIGAADGPPSTDAGAFRDPAASPKDTGEPDAGAQGRGGPKAQRPRRGG